MDNENDVERLFSWLQTPELRYREIAGTREIADDVVIVEERSNTPDPEPKPHHNVQLAEEYPQNQFPDQANVHVEVEHAPAERESPTIAPTSAPPAAPSAPPTVSEDAFVLGSAGRGGPRRPEFMEPLAPARVNPPPIAEPSAPAPAYGVSAPPEPAPAPPEPAPAPPASLPPQPTQAAPPPPAPEPAAPAAGGHLLGGAYRDNGPSEPAAAAPPSPEKPPSAESPQGDERSLDRVFGRLAASRDRLPDPRERLRQIPGLGTHGGRPR